MTSKHIQEHLAKIAAVEEPLKAKGYKYLGWQVYSANNEDFKKCHELGHRRDKDGKYNNGEIKEVSFSNRGSHHTYWCDECKIWWNIDMGD